MAKTIANVLVGVAQLLVRQPNDAIAEWTTDLFHQGTHSVKLTKTGTGNDGSTHLEIRPSGITLGTFFTSIGGPGTYMFWYHHSAVTANFTQVEFRFDDPNSDHGHCELTLCPFQGHAGQSIWTLADLQVLDPLAGYYGQTEVGTPATGWGAGLILSTVKTHIETNCTVAGIAGAADDWVLTRIRFELWEAGTARVACIDELTIHGSPYTVEPGGTAPAITLGSPYTEVGYTEDGVTLEYTADEADIEVEEETFPIDRVITKETLAVTCNMAESSLYNIDKAMAGSVLSGNIITLGGGVNKTMNLKIEGTNPAGYHRAIQIPLATATGAVGMSYKKDTKTVVPVTFQALKGDSPVCTIVDNVA